MLKSTTSQIRSSKLHPGCKIAVSEAGTPRYKATFLLSAAVLSVAFGSLQQDEKSYHYRSHTKCHGGGSNPWRRQQFERYLKRLTASDASVNSNNLPVYTSQDVARRNGTDGGPIWMSFGGYVYDFTSFIPYHPGGTERVSRAAGSAIEPYWYLHSQHYDTQEPLEIMRRLIVGKLSDKDQEKIDAELEQMEDELNSLQLQLDLTNIGGGVRNLSLNELKDLPLTDITSQVGCPKNQDRRSLSASLFGGVLLKDLLVVAAADVKRNDIKRISFSAMDGEEVSLDIVDDNQVQEILVCFEMDGVPLSKNRGFPFRVIIPGKRVVKWVKKIEVN